MIASYKLSVTTSGIFEIQMTIEEEKNHPWYIHNELLEAIKTSKPC